MAIPSKLKINLRTTSELRERCQRLADREQISLNVLLVRAVENYLPFRERIVDQEDRKRARAALSAGKAIRSEVPKVGANQACPCGSGQKYRRCHGV